MVSRIEREWKDETLAESTGSAGASPGFLQCLVFIGEVIHRWPDGRTRDRNTPHLFAWHVFTLDPNFAHSFCRNGQTTPFHET